MILPRAQGILRAVASTVVFFVLTINCPVRAVSIWSNPITGASSDGNPYTIGDVKDANISVSGIGVGSGVNANAGGGRYNFNNWSFPSLDANDYFSWTMTPNSGFAIDFNTLSGNWQRSGTGPVSYSLRSSLDNYATNIGVGSITGSGSAAAFSIPLTIPSLDAITSAVTFRLFAFGGSAAAGTFSINDFAFDGAVNATVTGNNSVITAPASAAFNRVMVNQTPTVNFSLMKTGSDATTYTATPSNNGITATPASGNLAAGPQSPSIALQLQSNANGSGTTGAKSYTVAVDNTAGTSSGAGQGSADPNDSVSVSATVVGNRTITASTVNLGSVIKGAATSTVASTLATTGDDDHFTRVTIDGAGATDSSVTVAAGSNQVFNAVASTTNRNVSGTFAAAGHQSGSIPLTVTGEGLTGEAANAVAVNYVADVFDASQAKFSSNGGDTLTLDLGAFAAGSGVHTASDAIYNVLQTAGFTAALDFDTISGTGDTSVLSTNLTNGAFTALAADISNAFSFNAALDANTAPGTYSATYTLKLSDADSYTGAGAAESQTLTLTLSGTVSPVSTVFAGDYNADGIVDAADYVVWRKSLTTATPLPANETATLGTTDDADYDAWRTNFGNVAAGSGAALGESAVAVPEPSPLALLAMSLMVALCWGPASRPGRATNEQKLV